jgi:hypothetical protein
MTFTQYDPGGFYDEMFEGIGHPRTAARALTQLIDALPADELQRRQR